MDAVIYFVVPSAETVMLRGFFFLKAEMFQTWISWRKINRPHSPLHREDILPSVWDDKRASLKSNAAAFFCFFKVSVEISCRGRLAEEPTLFTHCRGKAQLTA